MNFPFQQCIFHGSIPSQMVCDFCRDHLDVNKAAFADPRLELIIDDAKKQLEAGTLCVCRCRECINSITLPSFFLSPSWLLVRIGHPLLVSC